MKLSTLTLVALLATSSAAFAQSGRAFFGDGSVENTYQQKHTIATKINEQKQLPHNFIGRDAFGDGSPENTNQGNHHNQSAKNTNYSSIDQGRNNFGDGSPL